MCAMKNLKFVILPLIMLMAGCVTQKINVRALLDAGPKDQIYTAYNIFYSDPQDVPTINYRLAGKLLPAGTPIELLDTGYCTNDREDIVSFKVISTQRVYNMTHQKRWRAKDDDVHSFIKRLFTTQAFEKRTEGFSEDIIKEIKTGMIVKGMTKEQVIIALGYPATHRTQSLDNSTWMYWKDPDVCFRAIFKNGKISDILE